MTAQGDHAAIEVPSPGRAELILFGSLFLLPALAASFISQGIPAFLRMSGQSEEVIGLVFLAGLPFTLSFIWAPMIDRFGTPRLGYRRGWLLGTQVGIVTAVGVYLLLDPAAAAWAVIAVAGLTMALVGTYMAAASGYMLDALPRGDHAYGAAAQSAASGVAGLLFGLGILYLFGDLGWAATVTALLSVSVAGLVALWFLPLDKGKPLPARDVRAGVLATLAMLRRREVLQVFFFVQLMDAGITLAFALRPILQVDAGLSMSEIGLVGVVIGNAAGMLGAVAMAPLVKRLGGVLGLCLVALGAFALNVLMTVELAAAPSREVAILFVVAFGFLGFSGYTAGRTLFMAVCRPGRYASEFMTLMSLDAAFALVMAGVGSLIAGRGGLAVAFAVAAGVSLTAMGAALAVRRFGPGWRSAGTDGRHAQLSDGL